MGMMASVFYALPVTVGETASAGDGGRGWVFWLVLVIVVVIVALLLIRFPSLREKLKRMFRGAKRRWKIMRLKSRIKAEQKKMDEVIGQLGERAWHEGILPGGSDALALDLKTCDVEMRKNETETGKLAEQIAELNARLEEFKKKQQQQIGGEQEARRPFDDKLRMAQEKLREVNRVLAVKEKSAAALVAQLAAARTDQQKAGADLPPMDEPNQAERSKAALDKEIQALQQEARGLDSAVGEARQQADAHNLKISALENEGRNFGNDINRQVRELEGGKKRFQEAVRQAQEKQRPLFASLGNMLNDARQEREGLEPLYGQIDGSARRIRDLRAKVSELEAQKGQ